MVNISLVWLSIFERSSTKTRNRVQNARDGLRPSREPRTGRSPRALLIAARVTRRMGWPKPRGTHGSTRTFGRQVAWRGAGRPNLRVAFGPCRSVRRGEGGSCALRRFFPSPAPRVRVVGVWPLDSFQDGVCPLLKGRGWCNACETSVGPLLQKPSCL